MRRFFSLIFTIISFSFFVKSQNVYVSISSEMDSMILGKQSRKTDYCQYRLKISYENKTDSAIYFNKVVKDIQIGNNIGFPQFNGSSLYNPPKKSISSINYSNDTSVIVIPLNLNDPWRVFSDSIYSYNTRNSLLEDDLEIFYDSLYYNSLSEKSASSFTSLYWKHTLGRRREFINDFNAHQTDSLIKYNDFFVFLKPGETYSDYFDMSGFVYFKGHYCFMVKKNYWSDSIVVDVKYNDELKRNLQVTEPLPNSIGIYKLYSRPVISNVLYVDF